MRNAGFSDRNVPGGLPAYEFYCGGGGASHYPAGGIPAYPVPGKKYGAELFVRDGKRLELTRAGEILKRTMITMENDQRAMEKRMRESGNAVRTLTMGVTMTIGEYAVTGPLGPVSEPPSGRECMPADSATRTGF